MTISYQPQTSVPTIGDEDFVYTVTLLTEGTPTTKEVSLERLKEEKELERISCAESQTVVERLEASFLALVLNVEHTTPKSAFFCVCDSSHKPPFETHWPIKNNIWFLLTAYTIIINLLGEILASFYLF